MSKLVRTRSQSSERGNDEESSQLVGPAIVQQPTEEKCQVEPPTENQGITPSGEIKSEGAPAVQEPDVEALQQELALLKIEDEPGDGPDIRMGILPTFDLTTVLEAVYPLKVIENVFLLLKLWVIDFCQELCGWVRSHTEDGCQPSTPPALPPSARDP
ncbi:putative G antigen family E member 3 [Aotus nancymaae]|uniref:putative G antigen family E member 3 n=1 Tax=Aotus nancymaae TaxID=37293 RepID=UPI0030FE5F00